MAPLGTSLALPMSVMIPQIIIKKMLNMYMLHLLHQTRNETYKENERVEGRNQEEGINIRE